MTKQECAVVMAYTGVVMLTGDNLRIYYKYLNDIMGRPVYTHELAFKEIQEKIKEKSTNDFLKLCIDASNALDQQSSDDCISRTQAIEWIENLRQIDKCFGNYEDDYFPLSEVIDRLKNVPPSDVIERSKIDKAIEKIKLFNPHLEYDLSRSMYEDAKAIFLAILERNIGE